MIAGVRDQVSESPKQGKSASCLLTGVFPGSPGVGAGALV